MIASCFFAYRKLRPIKQKTRPEDAHALFQKSPPSTIMPQRWFMKPTEMLLVGDKSAYSMILYITAVYLILIVSVGRIGLKIKRTDT